MTAKTITAEGQNSKHPKGLYYLSFTEMWERFSFYGMSALLTLYMVKELLLPENAALAIGLAELRGIFEFRGPMSNVAFAALIYGWYAGLVYFTPIIGGWVADKILGAKRTVMIGVIFMSMGHLLMSFYATFLAALLFLILGSGFLKGNISAQVGTLYPAEAESMRSRGFTLFSTGICIGAALGPVVTGLVASIYGFHAGFAVAALLMMVALISYILAQPHLPETRPSQTDQEKTPPLSADEKRQLYVLIGVIFLTIPAEITYPMVWSIGILWVDQYVNPSTPLGTIPSSWFAGLDSFGSVLFAPAIIALWAWQAKRGSEPSSLTKIGLGTAIVSFAALLMAYGNWGVTGNNNVNAFWAVAGWLVMGLGWMYYWPTNMALVSSSAPERLRSTMMGVAFLSPFVAHTMAGWVGSYFDQMSPSAFWVMDAAIGFVGAGVILLLRGPLTRALAPRA